MSYCICIVTNYTAACLQDVIMGESNPEEVPDSNVAAMNKEYVYFKYPIVL